jgi:hypothetical protein
MGRYETMARLKTATVEYGRVINLGEYNSLRASCTLGVEFEEGEDVDAALAGLWEKARENVRAQVVRVRPGNRVADGDDADPPQGTEGPPSHG